MADGKTADDALAWLKTRQGAPPLTNLGGAVVGRQGGYNAFKVKLAKGTYAFYCSIADSGDATRTPHFAKGMFQGVTIT